MSIKCTQRNKININSYNKKSVIKYYERLANVGLFEYEKYIVSKYFKENSKVLDIGCGTGRVTNELYNMGYNVSGIDYSKGMLRVARKINPFIEYSLQSVCSLEYNDNYFDCALFSFNGLMLIETYDDRATAIREMFRVLKNDGILFFSTPFLDNKLNGKFWIKKIKQFGKDINSFSDKEKILLGDELINDNGTDFKIHVPFLFEVINLINEVSFNILFSMRRIDMNFVEKCEDDLDDNYIWVVKKSVLL